jgi:hypothetical protein
LAARDRIPSFEISATLTLLRLSPVNRVQTDAGPTAPGGRQTHARADLGRLAMWRDIAQRYFGREAEAFDETGKGFARG